MDLQLYARVLRRFRWLIVTGLVVAIGLSFLATFRVTSSGVAYRQSEVWSSTSRLGVTQQGFPWGRLFAQGASDLTPAQQAARLGIPIADPNRFKDLAFLYAALAVTDPVRQLMLRRGSLDGEFTADPVIGENGITLPLIDIIATGSTPQSAKALARRAAAALGTYVAQQQQANKVPASDRVILQSLLNAEKAEIVKSRSKTMAVVVFLAVMFAFVGLAFLLENTRSRASAREEDEEPLGPEAETVVPLEHPETAMVADHDMRRGEASLRPGGLGTLNLRG
jgi:hypothetical protein